MNKYQIYSSQSSSLVLSLEQLSHPLGFTRKGGKKHLRKIVFLFFFNCVFLHLSIYTVIITPTLCFSGVGEQTLEKPGLGREGWSRAHDKDCSFHFLSSSQDHNTSSSRLRRRKTLSSLSSRQSGTKLEKAPTIIIISSHVISFIMLLYISSC